MLYIWLLIEHLKRFTVNKTITLHLRYRRGENQEGFHMDSWQMEFNPIYFSPNILTQTSPYIMNDPNFFSKFPINLPSACCSLKWVASRIGEKQYIYLCIYVFLCTYQSKYCMKIIKTLLKIAC